MNKFIHFVNEYRAFEKHEFLDVFVAGLTVVVHGGLLFLSILPLYILYKGLTAILDKTITYGSTLYVIVGVIGSICTLGLIFWLIGAPTKDDKSYDNDY